MVTPKKVAFPPVVHEVDLRERLALVRVLVADRDHRTASLVQRILFSFGFRNMDVTTSGESALALLKSRPYDILITEWNMVPIDGVALVKAIRSAQHDKRIPRDIPILMLTARADKDSVSVARDAGITEFVVKPFSAKTMSNRIIRIIDNPRAFVESGSYTGPDRRRKGSPPPGAGERRGRGKAEVTPANAQLRKQLGNVSAAEIIDNLAVNAAQNALNRAESEFIDWARSDVIRLEISYQALRERPSSSDALRDLTYAAYAIKSQAGIFGYALGTEVAGLLVDFLESRKTFGTDHLVVIGKHIETINVIFREQIKESGQAVAMDMIHSLKKLSEKLG